MGNSNGGLADYWDAFARHRQLQGGFIWEWKDHALRQRLADGRVRLAYGGQFGDEPNDANFVADGLCSAELVPHPAMTEVAWVHRPVAVRRLGDRLVVENRESFRDTAWLRATWELLVDGHATRRGTLALPAIAPGALAVIPLPVARPRLPRGQEAHLTVTFATRRETPWSPSGTVVAWDQVELGRAPAARLSSPSSAEREVEVDDRPQRVSLRAGSLTVEVDRSSGHVVRLEADRQPLVVGTLRLEVWRAPTDNDGLKLLPVPSWRPLARWRSLGLDVLERRCESVEVVTRRGRTLVVATHVLQPAAAPAIVHRQELALSASGLEIRDEVEVPDDLSDLPRLGCSFFAPAGLHTVEWFGLGPGENYPDRCRGAIVGRHAAPVDELPYLMPQEFGLRGGVREWSLTGDQGLTLNVAPMQPRTLWISGTHHTVDDLTSAREQLELRRRAEVVVHVDVAHRGLGTASCGPDTAPTYRLRAGSWRWRWRLGAGSWST
jgi:beta-galactosidase